MRVRRVLLCALPQEARALLKLLGQARRLPGNAIAPHASLTCGLLNGEAVAVVVSGEGMIRSRQAMQWIDAEFDRVPLVSFGVAGALSADLVPGDLLWARQVLTRNGESEVLLELPLDSADSSLEELRVAARPGTFLTVPRPVTDVSERRSALEQVHGAIGSTRDSAASHPVCVEMECYPIAQSCALSGRPFLMLRSISDGADQQLPALLGRHRTEDGATDVVRLALAAAVRPQTWIPLLRLGARVSVEASAMAKLLAGS